MNSVKKPLLISLSVGLFFLYLMLSHQKHESESSLSARRDLIKLIETKFFDLKFLIRGPVQPSGRIGILAIDDKTLKEFGRWPIHRKFYEQAFANLKKRGTKWIGFDVLFSEKQEDTLKDLQDFFKKNPNWEKKQIGQWIADEDLNKSWTDESFSKGLKKFGGIIQGFVFSAGISQNSESQEPFEQNQIEFLLPVTKGLQNFAHHAQTDLILNHPLLQHKENAFAFFNNQSDWDGVVRTVQLLSLIQKEDGQLFLMPSLSLSLASHLLDVKPFAKMSEDPYFLIESLSLGTQNIPLTFDGQGRALLNHYGPFYSFPHISFQDAYHDQLPENLPEALLLGGTATGINDIRPSPFDENLQGVEHHAAMTENLISQNFISRDILQFGLELLLTLVIALTSGYLFSRKSLLSFLFFLTTISFIFILDFFILFPQGILFYSATPISQIALSYLLTATYLFFQKEKEASQIRSAFQHYLHPTIVNQLVSEPSLLKLSGERKFLTVLFSDIRDFTSISETLEPENLSLLLNAYLTPMSNIILKSKGVLDKYIGDAIMAFWGAPLSLSNHADRGLAAAFQMIQTLAQLRNTDSQLTNLSIGVGVHTGFMAVGNMGSSQRFDFTVLGDSVNLGARLEGLTKEYQLSLLCSEDTLKNLQEPDIFHTREIDLIKVKGKSQPVRIFDVFSISEKISEQDQELKKNFEEGLMIYREGKWEKAIKKFQQILEKWPQDGPSQTFLQRSQQLSEKNPEDWQGVWTMSHK